MGFNPGVNQQLPASKCVCGIETNTFLFEEFEGWYCNNCEDYKIRCRLCDRISKFNHRSLLMHNDAARCLYDDCDRVAAEPKLDELELMALESADAAHRIETLDDGLFPASCSDCGHMGLEPAYEDSDFYVCPKCRMMCSLPEAETVEFHRERAAEYEELKRQKEAPPVIVEPTPEEIDELAPAEARPLIATHGTDEWGNTITEIINAGTSPATLTYDTVKTITKIMTEAKARDDPVWGVW